ncbi:pickpocket protein 19-like isoform X1 [Hylaeus anthracinus]|uniref:pickpocket protein 19-like isoform X1 n=1 Tax=Hylaeus anthracinus TaxID=313031 RepID=UPI0023B8CA7E|nr:pickpocket protein 19-like isoform X1 [Hylaeus anthracinus]XP_054012504.1 pickpocket protein 19-like isoform X1 [Hylaeus anthracinus]XP_054012505.1 pickpocket protein 19-like isoform X1 [Hylaeus anthracinus]XP_054012506.1 pickpocket protein 19-like isoform X1 [Hylaeus anthracinus]XP_054012507.1 pickpocket protein 19-like isoform X1 [Hylaeus anthracinus]
MILKRSEKNMFARAKPNPWKNRSRKIERRETLLSTVRRYCASASFHGLRYVVDPRLHKIERSLWFAVFAVHAAVAASVIYYVASKLQAAPTSIGIESMNHRISSLPFPSVTLCPNNRVDWDKAVDLEKQIFSNSTDQQTLQTFRDFLAGLSVLSFGDFHRLDFLKRVRLDGLMDVNVTDALLQVVPNCEQLFTDCWWRNSNRDCCEIFELHKTEYGFCYSFNSQLAEKTVRRKHHGHREERPRRATSFGAWSGLRVTARFINVTKPPDFDEADSIIFILEDPRVWPTNGRMIPINSLTTVSFDCISGFATQSIHDLGESRAPCRHLPGSLYTQETCLSMCKREHVIKHCGCNPSFLFPSVSQRDCGVKDFLCLIDHNDLYKDNAFTDEKGPIDEDAMVCDCPPACDYYIYTPHLAAVRTYRSQDITLDVHFSSQANFRYKMDLIYSNLHFLVSFGGIIGLFLGGSLLSAVELIYYLMVLVFSYLRCYRSPGGQQIRPGRAMAVDDGGYPPTLSALSVPNYNSIKPRSRRSPILVNYTSVKSNLNRY